MAKVRWAALATDLAELARDLLAQDSVQATLDTIVHSVVRLVDGCDAAGILEVRAGRVHTLAATDNVVVASDRLQDQFHEGPCFDADRTKEEVYRIEDLTASAERWPRYVPRARELGIGSVMGFLLYTREHELGALDMYSARPGAFTAEFEHVGWVLAAHSAVALSAARYERHLQVAMESRRLIGEATGIVMARDGLSEEAAFAKIVKLSQDHNIKVRDLAERITDAGDLPALG